MYFVLDESNFQQSKSNNQSVLVHDLFWRLWFYWSCNDAMRQFHWDCRQSCGGLHLIAHGDNEFFCLLCCSLVCVASNATGSMWISHYDVMCVNVYAKCDMNMYSVRIVLLLCCAFSHCRTLHTKLSWVRASNDMYELVYLFLFCWMPIAYSIAGFSGLSHK